MHFFDPVTETVHDHSTNHGMIGVERVSGAAVVCVARAIRFKEVIGLVLDAAKAQRRPGFIALRRMVEDDVQE